MPDLTMCTSPSCKLRERCYRCTSKPSIRALCDKSPENECEFSVDSSDRVNDNSGNDEEEGYEQLRAKR